MNPLSLPDFDTFYNDFRLATKSLGSGGELSIGFVQSCLAQRYSDTPESLSSRSRAVFRSYAYLFWNRSSFEDAGLAVLGGGSDLIKPGVIFSLYVFFVAAGLYEEQDPPLDLVIQAAQKHEEERIKEN